MSLLPLSSDPNPKQRLLHISALFLEPTPGPINKYSKRLKKVYKEFWKGWVGVGCSPLTAFSRKKTNDFPINERKLYHRLLQTLLCDMYNEQVCKIILLFQRDSKQKISFVKSHILGHDGVWYSSF